MIDARDVGGFFLGEDGEVWSVVCYSAEPTVSFERVKDGIRKGGVVGSPIVSGFRRLIPADEIGHTDHPSERT